MQPIKSNHVRLKAMNLLARREYLRSELADRLHRSFGGGAGAEPNAEARAEVAAVLQQLSDERLQCDRRYIESYIRQRAGRGYGPARIRRELKQKGADPDAVGLALDASGEDWLDLARRALRKKFGPDEPGDFAERARRLRFLDYRGFPGDLFSQLYAEE